jgi:hypothetical protein
MSWPSDKNGSPSEGRASGIGVSSARAKEDTTMTGEGEERKGLVEVRDGNEEASVEMRDDSEEGSVESSQARKNARTGSRVD